MTFIELLLVIVLAILLADGIRLGLKILYYKYQVRRVTNLLLKASLEPINDPTVSKKETIH